MNRKDVPVTVWDMQVVFYSADKPFDDEERPNMEYTRDPGGKGPFELMTLPPRIPVTRTIIVTPPFNMPDILRTFEEADRIEFAAEIEGAGTLSARLAPWGTLEPQERRVETPRTLHPTS